MWEGGRGCFQKPRDAILGLERSNAQHLLNGVNMHGDSVFWSVSTLRVWVGGWGDNLWVKMVQGKFLKKIRLYLRLKRTG